MDEKSSAGASGVHAGSREIASGDRAKARWKLIARRWLDVLVQAAAGAGILLLVGPRLAGKVVSNQELLFSWKCVPLGVIVLTGILLLGRTGLLGNPGWARAHVNPPRWLVVLFAIALGIAAWATFPSVIPKELGRTSDFFRQNRWILVWISVATSLVATVAPPICRRAIRRLRPSRGPAAGGIVIEAATFSDLRIWLRTDDEIREPSQDAFSHSRIAARTADRISRAAKGDLGRCPTFALVGEIGSGKSSIRELVRYTLDAHGLLGERILVVPVSLWPFETPEAAIRGILSAIEAEFARLTSTSSILGIPIRYLALIEKLDRRFGILSLLLASERTPEAALRSYDSLAKLVGVQVVVWIEDMERFEGSSAAAATRTAPIRALMHLLQEFERLTVVLASDTLTFQIDLYKLVRFVESIPELETDTAWPVISRFRAACLGMFPGEIDPAASEARKQLSPTEPSVLSVSEGIRTRAPLQHSAGSQACTSVNSGFVGTPSWGD
jgi:hypothetical protein